MGIKLWRWLRGGTWWYTEDESGWGYWTKCPGMTHTIRVEHHPPWDGERISKAVMGVCAIAGFLIVLVGVE